MSDIRRDFEKAYFLQFGYKAEYPQAKASALWATKWMAERILQEEHHNYVLSEKIRQLVNDLES